MFDAESWVSGALLNWAELGAGQWLCPSIPLCLLLKIFDGIPDLCGVIPTSSVSLPYHPTIRGMNTAVQFRIGEDLK